MSRSIVIVSVLGAIALALALGGCVGTIPTGHVGLDNPPPKEHGCVILGRDNVWRHC